MLFILGGAVLDCCVGAGGRVACTCWLVPVFPFELPAAPAAPAAPVAPAATVGGLLFSPISVISAIDINISEID